MLFNMCFEMVVFQAHKSPFKKIILLFFIGKSIPSRTFKLYLSFKAVVFKEIMSFFCKKLKSII